MIKSIQSLMLAFVLLSTVLVVVGCAGSKQRTVEVVAPSLDVYEGAWFRIHFPETFIAQSSLASASADGHDSVFFRSPDGSVEFYVCAPQWGRTTPDITLVDAVEMLISEKSVERGIEVMRSWTIVARDGSYTRSYEEIASADGTTRTVFGFRYANDAARERHLPVYTEFKKSLEQYAD